MLRAAAVVGEVISPCAIGIRKQTSSPSSVLDLAEEVNTEDKLSSRHSNAAPTPPSTNTLHGTATTSVLSATTSLFLDIDDIPLRDYIGMPRPSRSHFLLTGRVTEFLEGGKVRVQLDYYPKARNDTGGKYIEKDKRNAITDLARLIGLSTTQTLPQTDIPNTGGTPIKLNLLEPSPSMSPPLSITFSQPLDLASSDVSSAFKKKYFCTLLSLFNLEFCAAGNW